MSVEQKLLFVFDGEINVSKKFRFSVLSIKVNNYFSGVGHNEDLGYIFDFGYSGSAADYLTRNRLVLMWTNFAKTGNPTPINDQTLNRVRWPTNAGKGQVTQLHIDRDLRVVTNPNSVNNNFWANLFASRGRPPYNTY